MSRQSRQNSAFIFNFDILSGIVDGRALQVSHVASKRVQDGVARTKVPLLDQGDVNVGVLD